MFSLEKVRKEVGLQKNVHTEHFWVKTATILHAAGSMDFGEHSVSHNRQLPCMPPTTNQFATYAKVRNTIPLVHTPRVPACNALGHALDQA